MSKEGAILSRGPPEGVALVAQELRVISKKMMMLIAEIIKKRASFLCKVNFV